MLGCYLTEWVIQQRIENKQAKLSLDGMLKVDLARSCLQIGPRKKLPRLIRNNYR